MTLDAGRRDPHRHARGRGRRQGRRRGRHARSTASAGWSTPSSATRRSAAERATSPTKRMRIQHLIDGRPVDSRGYFETVNPATQEVLAEVARGGADEVDAAVAAAKAAFPAWAARPATERAAADAQARRPDRAARARARRETETQRHRPGRSRRPASSSCRARPTTSTTSPRCARASTATPIRRRRTSTTRCSTRSACAR